MKKWTKNKQFNGRRKKNEKPLLLRQRTGVQARLRTIRRECRHVPRRQTHRDPERDTGANPMRPHDRQQLACRRKLHTTRFAVQHLRTGEKQDRCRKSVPVGPHVGKSRRLQRRGHDRRRSPPAHHRKTRTVAVPHSIGGRRIVAPLRPLQKRQKRKGIPL